MELAVQLYSVRTACAEDLERTLAWAAGIGVAGVELAGLGGRDAAWWRGTLVKLGLRACAAHVGLDGIEADAKGALEPLREIGVTRAVVPWLPAPTSVEEAERAAVRVRRAMEKITAAGLHAGYHNHDFEFAGHGGVTLWDLLERDQRVVEIPGAFWEPDLGWVWFAGQDVAAWWAQRRSHCPLVHVKDMVRTDTGRTFAVVGSGQVGYRELLPRLDLTDVEWLIVEQDDPGARGSGSAAEKAVMEEGVRAMRAMLTRR